MTMHKMYPDVEEKIGTDGDEKQVIYFTWPNRQSL